MNACFTTSLMQQYHRLFGVLVLSLFSCEMAAYAAPVAVSKKTLQTIAAVKQADAGGKLALLNPNATPAVLPASSGSITVLFSVPLVGKATSSDIVYLRRIGDKEGIAMNDLGKDGDFIARDGIHGVNVKIDTDKVKPDSCLSYETYIRRGRAEQISRPLRLCVSSLPVGIAKSDISTPAIFPKGTRAVADELLITVTPATSVAAIRELASSINASVVGSILPLNFYQLKLSSPASANRLLEIVAQLKASKGVVNASINAIGQGALDVNDTAFDLLPTDANSQHGLKLAIAHNEATNANAWDAGYTGNGITVVVLDTGIESSHSDLNAAWTCQDVPLAIPPLPVPVVLTPCSATAIGTTPAEHGTEVTGVIAARTNNGTGVAGVAFDSSIHAIKMRNFTTAGMIAGFQTAAGYVGVNGNAKVVNASFNVVDVFTVMDTLCASIESVVTSGTGAIVVNAAGNQNINGASYPSRCNDLNVNLSSKQRFITVSNSASFVHSSCGSVGVDQRCAAAVPANPAYLGSNYGSWVTIAAPGSVIRTTMTGNTYSSPTGTSFSAPMVSGAVALLASCGMPMDQIKSTLTSSANVTVPYPLSGVNPAGTTPRLDIHRALSYQAPTAIGPLSSSINEGNLAGATVASLTATDSDVCDRFTFSLVAGAGSTDNGSFTITGNQLTINGSADYEIKQLYNIRVRVTDFGGFSNEQALTVNVNNLNDTPPVITSNGGGAAATVTVQENSTAVTTVMATDADNLGPLTYSISGGADAAEFVINSSTGALSFAAPPNFEVPADLDSNNIYDVIVQASDGTFTDTQAIAVTVTNVNEAPVANDDTLAAIQNTPVTYTAAQLLGNDTDVDAGTTLAIAGGSVTSGAGGTAVLNGDGTVTFTPNPGFTGPASFTYRATDGSLPSNVATVTVNVSAMPHAPVANDDTLAATEDIPVTYAAAQLLGNDTDADAGTTLTVASVTSGAGGTAVLNGDGTVTFSPSTNFNGTANFTYRATDGGLLSNVATVTVNVAPVNDAPTGLPYISGTRTVGQTLTANTLTATFPNPIVDADGLGAFTYQWQASGLSVGGNSDTYVLAPADLGKFMSVCVSWTDGGGTPESLCSATDATAVGDPHITTVDGLHYDFQGAGEFVALRGANGTEIQLRMAAVPTAPPLPDSYTGLTSGVSVNTAVAARVGKHRVTYQPDTSPNAAGGTFVLRVDGVVTTLPADGIDLGDGGRVVSQASGIQIDFPDQTTLQVNTSSWPFYGAWWLHVSVFHTSAYEGIMGARSTGSWLPRLSNGSALGAMPATLHKRYVELYVKFADSWRVNKETTLFDYDKDTSTATFTNKAWPTENGPYDTGTGPVAKPLGLKAAQLACRNVAGKNANADCVFDVRVMGNADLARGHVLTQKIRTGLTAIIVNDDRAFSKDKEMVTFTATVARHAAITRKGLAGKGENGVPKGIVQFTLNGNKVGKPVRLDARGQAQLKLPRLKIEKQTIGARYIPVKGSVFLPSSSFESARIMVEGKR